MKSKPVIQDQPDTTTKSFLKSSTPLISADDFLKSAPKIAVNVIERINDVPPSTLSYSLLPTSQDNFIVAALKTLGLYKKPLGLGKHDITCLWVANHTKRKDDGAIYIEGNGKNKLGGFKCHHTHCLNKDRPNFIAALEEAISKLEAAE